MRNVLVSTILLVPTGPAFAQGCPAPLNPMQRVEMYFGRSVESGTPVTDRHGRSSLTQEMTSQFPGLTVLNAQGAWRCAPHLREHTKLVIVVLPDEPAAREQIAVVAASYKNRFHQKAVGIVTNSVSASFD